MRNSKKEFISLAIALGIILALVANLFEGRLFATGDDVYDSLEIFSTALEKVQEEYVREVSSKELIQGALFGMLHRLDPHSSYIPPGTYERLRVETEGEYEGVGITLLSADPMVELLSPTKNPLKVQSTIPGTPAFRSDIMEGDSIIKIDGESIDGLSIDDAVKKIKGPRGTKVTLTIQRIISKSGEEKVFDVELVRAKIPLLSVAHADLVQDGMVAYIRLADFKENSAEELKGKIAELREKGMKALVLDLRFNPGGLLSTAARVADLFLRKGAVIVSTKGRRPEDAMTLESEHDPILTKEECPMAVLVNDGSASASEIVTSALQENGRAIVVGTRTYGKSSVQTVIGLKDESALKLTTAYYYTPRGERLSHNGIKPDIEVALPHEDDITKSRLRAQLPDDRMGPFRKKQEDEPEEKVEDTQLAEAITVLRGYVVLASRAEPKELE